MQNGSSTVLSARLEELGKGAQADLALYLKCSPSTVNRWAKGKVRPHRWYREQVVAWLNDQGIATEEQELWPR